MVTAGERVLVVVRVGSKVVWRREALRDSPALVLRTELLLRCALADLLEDCEEDCEEDCCRYELCDVDWLPLVDREVDCDVDWLPLPDLDEDVLDEPLREPDWLED